MDGNVQRWSGRSSSLAQSSTEDQDDDNSDTISLTSTVEPQDPSDTEYVVEGIHAEREQKIDGKQQPLFLVEWTNFTLDQCTWEPLENLTDELAKQWKDKKATQDPIVALEFEDKYKAAFDVKLEAARQRHRRRNAKRKRLGNPVTPFWFRGQQQSDSDSEMEVVSAEEIQDSEAEEFNPPSDGDDECDEVNEDNAIDHKALEASNSTKSSCMAKLPKPTRPPSRVFTFDPDKAPRSANVKSSEATLPKSSQTSTRPNSAREPKKPQSSKQPSRERELSSSTGYQGSARKSSTGDSSPSRPGNISVPKATALASATVSTNAPVSIVPAATVFPQAAGKKYTARKTTKTTTPINIFSGGRIPRSRQGVGETEVDSNQVPKHFSNHNHLRKSELRSRERDDQPPDISKIASVMFIPGSSAESTQSAPQGPASTDAGSSEGGPGEIAQEPQEQPSTMPLYNEAGSTTAGNRYAGPPKRSSLSLRSSVDRPNKKAKKVHFTEVEAEPSGSQGLCAVQTRSERFPEADDKWIPTQMVSSNINGDAAMFVDEPMNIDSTSSCSPDPPMDTPSSSVMGAKKLSLFAYKSRNTSTTQNVGKKIKLSTSPDVILDVTFDAVPRAAPVDTDQKWLNDFLDTSCLDIGHVFLAESLITQLPTLSSQGFQPLCSGTVTSTTNSKILDILAEHLRIGSSGLFVAQAHLNLLIFPTRCADFDSLNHFGVESTSPESVSLRYFMFRSELPIFQHIRPSSSTVKELGTRVGEEKVLLFPTILGIQYSALVASPEQDKKKPVHFFLAFPVRAVEWQQSIASWLSTRNGACKIYTSFESGSWLAFVERAKKERGVVIVHEALFPFLRRFPQLAKLLLKHPVNIWHFSESFDLGPPQSLVGSGITPAMSTKLSRLFPIGTVVLVTPSFMVSEPQAAYKFFKWFFELKAKQGNHKLVLAYNITEYLADLSREKISLRAHLQKTLWTKKFKTPENIAKDKSDGALTDQDLEARQKTWFYVDWWLSEQVHREIPFSDFNSAIFADRSIDPHDEQSLVNWFGWWSLQHSHEYRNFHVLGSSGRAVSSVRHTLTSRTSRRVPLVPYSAAVVNDPDEAMRIALSKQGTLSTTSFGFRSKCFHNDENRIGPWLESQDKGFYYAKLYRYPVSWADKTMAAHYGDPSMSFKTIEQWWDSVLPWNSGSHHYNTFIGFFYTISEQWNPDKLDKSDKPIQPRRDPWLAIWRPVDPHEKATLFAHGKTELIIWDIRAGELETKTDLNLKDLTWMQQALIRHVQLYADKKNPNSFLDRVWLGGFQTHQLATVSMEPADVTAEFLMRLSESLKHNLAATGKNLERSGYRRVDLRLGIKPSGTYRQEQDHADVSLDTRIIFHPPRGSRNLQPEGTSKCINELFEAVRLERLRVPIPKDMIYTYAPTVTWYRKQVAEGRHFGHILVDEWDKVFSAMDINKSSLAPVSDPGDRDPQASIRRSSGSSNHSSATYGTPLA